jgi:hypothetical protein
VHANAAEEAPPGAPGALVESQPEASTLVGPAGAQASSDAAVASLGATAEIIAAQQAKELRCELSAVGGRMTSSCSAGTLSTQSFASTAPSGLANGVVSLAAAAGGSPPGPGNGGSASGGPPVSPTPGPAPGGASGAAPGASGVALSGFFTLAGLLLLGAPRAMRRLRLSCTPWRTACFVLIPERPG